MNFSMHVVFTTVDEVNSTREIHTHPYYRSSRYMPRQGRECTSKGESKRPHQLFAGLHERAILPEATGQCKRLDTRLDSSVLLVFHALSPLFRSLLTTNAPSF